MYINAFNMLSKSILSSDFYILAFAIFDLLFMLLTCANAREVEKRKKDWIKNKNRPFTAFILKSINKSYTMFTTTITIFPLLGMFGTVCGLLGLDLASGDMQNVKNNFFIALTSTAWGIIFSVIFKILNAIIQDYVEEQIETAKILSAELVGLKEGGR